MNFVEKVNKYLLEHHPLIWNTRLVWMLLTNIVLHILFFILGFTSVNGIHNLKEEYSLDSFFNESSAVYYNFLISIIILLIWIVFYLRNNAFKHIYSIKKRMLFKQFCIIVFIFFISSSQYFSFKQGLKIKIKSIYSWAEVDKDIKAFNRTALFLTQNQDYYEIDQRKYPVPFPLKVARGSANNFQNNIDTTQAYLKYKGSYFQFYQWVNQNNDAGSYVSKVGRDYSQNRFGDRIVKDVSKFSNYLHPSLSNYSRQLISSGQDSNDHNAQLKSHQSILKNKNKIAIKNNLTTFILLANKYDVKHNLEVDSWFQLINNEPYFHLKKLIGKHESDMNYNYSKSDKIEFYSNTHSRIRIQVSKKLFCTLTGIDNFFKNVHEAYFPKFEIVFLCITIGGAFILALLMFLFKTTSAKSLLLSVVASIVVLIIVVWLMNSPWIFGYSNNHELNVMIFISLLITFLAIVSYVSKWKKIMITIFWSLGVFAVPTFFLFIAFSYIKHIDRINRNIDNSINVFEIWFSNYGFFTILLISFITVFIYSIYIRKLKARTD